MPKFHIGQKVWKRYGNSGWLAGTVIQDGGTDSLSERLGPIYVLDVPEQSQWTPVYESWIQSEEEHAAMLLAQ